MNSPTQPIVKERPILFSGAMVRALLAGSKTQTRRVVKGLEYDADMLGGVYMFNPPKGMGSDTAFAYCKNPAASTLLLATCPYGQPGERLWVRETIYAHPAFSSAGAKAGLCGGLFTAEGENCAFRGYVADGGYTKPFKQIPAIHMPRAASRLLLEITAVRCERLQNISEADAVAEGIEPVFCPTLTVPAKKWKNYQGRAYCDGMNLNHATESYQTLWASINGPDSWAANPWVWVVEFKVVEGGKETAGA